VTIAAILSLVGVIVGIVTSTISNVSGIVTSSTGTSGVSISLPSPWVWVGLVGISVAIEIAGLVMFRSAFRTLARVDRRFSTPAMLALAAIASFVVILLGLGLLLGALY
jgi:bacteriorhodopsin